MTIPAYPLQWPAGWKRTESYRRAHAKFGRKQGFGRTELTISQATSRVCEELRRMDVDDIVISTNLALRLDGLPRSGQREPEDPAVAVYWRSRDDETRCMAIDRYYRIADNLAAVAATLDAMRAIERHGGAEILNRAFTGFTALPAPGGMDWRQILDEADPEGSYRRERARHHPDRGGDADQFRAVQAAWETFQQERKA